VFEDQRAPSKCFAWGIASLPLGSELTIDESQRRP
jgi:hypothetical protein